MGSVVIVCCWASIVEIVVVGPVSDDEGPEEVFDDDV